jgi:hypothetical protein
VSVDPPILWPQSDGASLLAVWWSIWIRRCRSSKRATQDYQYFRIRKIGLNRKVTRLTIKAFERALFFGPSPKILIENVTEESP